LTASSFSGIQEASEKEGQHSDYIVDDRVKQLFARSLAAIEAAFVRTLQAQGLPLTR
jgi:hypothetical protein